MLPSRPPRTRGRRALALWCAALSLLVAAPAGAVSLFHSAPKHPERANPQLVIGENERLLVIAPHPDDETIGAAGLIQRVLEQNGTVRVVLMTAGDGYVEAVTRETHQPKPRPADYIAFGERRMKESRAAMRLLDHGRIHMQLLGFPDGGLDGLLRAHWLQPERSKTTDASDPPYDSEVIDPNVPYDGADLRRELGTIIAETRPTIVVLPDPLDQHPDHHATGVFGLLAIGDWLNGTTSAEPKQASNPVMPRILAYLVHWPDWPPDAESKTFSKQDEHRTLALPHDLPHRAPGHVALRLTDHELEKKHAAMALYASQQAVMPDMLAAFVRRTEPFSQLGPGAVHAAHQLIPLPTPTASPRP
jgi:LmbE family N-acetylglucosaminyl deacetylase